MEFMACQGKGQRSGLDWLTDFTAIWNIEENILKCGEEEEGEEEEGEDEEGGGGGGEIALVELAAWAAAKNWEFCVR